MSFHALRERRALNFLPAQPALHARHASRALHVLLACAAVLLVTGPAAAQLSRGGTPPALDHGLRPAEAVTLVMPEVNPAQLFAEDDAAPKGTPFRFGTELPVALGLEHGGIDMLPDGSQSWRLRLESPGAFSLAVHWSDFELGRGARLFVYDDSLSTILGAYDWANNQPDGLFFFEPVPGEAITLELHLEAGAEWPARFRADRVVHDYRDLYRHIKSSPGDAAGACNVDVNCPQGAPWQQQKRAVTLIIAGGSLCTGALINNALNDGTQYYMTAFHCGSMNSAVFRLNYERSGCGSGGAPTNQTVQGSTYLAGSSSLDYRLVRLNQTIPSGYQPYFLGWNRSTSPGAGTATIHHPDGDVKKISLDYQAPSLSGSQWRIVQWDLGVTEPGSSGCPLLDNQGRFIGQLCCGQAYCGFPYNDYYGRFDQAWNGVKTWLDPANTNVTAIAGFDPAGGGPTPPVLASVSPASVQAFQGGTVTLSGSGFTGATSVNVGGQILGAGQFTVVTANTISFALVNPPSLGAKTVTVTTPSGTSAGKTLTVAATHPPKLSAAGFAGSGQVFPWSYGGGAGHTAWLLIATNSATFPYGGYTIVNGSVVLAHTLGPAGLGAAQATIPAGLVGLTFWSQIVTFNGGSFHAASNSTSTWVLF